MCTSSSSSSTSNSENLSHTVELDLQGCTYKDLRSFVELTAGHPDGMHVGLVEDPCAADDVILGLRDEVRYGTGN